MNMTSKTVKAKFSGDKSKIEALFAFLEKSYRVELTSGWRDSDIPGESFIYTTIEKAA
jgi:hypothetical protein